MALLEISVVPVGTGTPSVSRYVAGAVRLLREHPEVKYELTSMGTILEGNLDQVMGLARQMHQSPFGEGVQRVVTTIKIDERRDKPSSMAGKIDSVRRKLSV